MEAMIYLTVALIMLSITYRLITSISGALSLDFLSFWFYIYIIFAFIGSCVIMLGLGDESYFVRPIADNADVIVIGSYFVLYGGVATFLTFIAFITIFNAKRLYVRKLTKVCETDSTQYNVLIVLLCIYILIFLYHQVSIYPSPLIMAFNHNAPEEIALRRLTVTRDLGLIANSYIISIGNLLTYIVPYSYLALASIKRKYYLHSFLSFVVAIVFILSTGEKGPFLFFILGALICYSYARGYVKRISLKLILLLVSLLFLIYYLFVSDDISYVLTLIFDRVFIAQVISVYLSYDHYSYFGDLGISTLSNIVTKFLDLKVVAPSSEQLLEYYFPEMIALGGWNVNGFYISEAWSNYGGIGVILSPLLVGFENAILVRVLVSFRKTPIQCAFYAFLTIKCAYFLTSFNAYLYHSDWIVTAIVLLFIIFLNLIFNLKSKRVV